MTTTKARAHRNDGSIVKRGTNKWEVTVVFDNPLTGEKKRVSRRVNGSMADARKIRDDLKQQRDGGITTDAETITFAEYAEQWKESQETTGGLSTRTLEENNRVVKVLSSYIGKMRLKNITPNVVESLYSKMKKDHGYSGTSMNKYHIKLKQILKHAVNHDFILRNPCDRVATPKKNKVERRSLTREQALKLLECIDTSEAAEYNALADKAAREAHWCTDGISHHTGNARTAIRGVHDLSNIIAIRIGLATGMRIGEVLALTWNDVDLTKGKIHVRHNLTNYGDIKEPKSRAGVRTISLDGKTRLHLITWKAEQAHYLEKIDLAQTTQTPVCCSDVGSYNQLNNYETWWRSWRDKNGFDGLKFHELRHTQATQLLANGVDVKTVQTRLGHANASLTLDVYGHAIPENDESAAELIGNLFTENGQAQIIEVSRSA